MTRDAPLSPQKSGADALFEGILANDDIELAITLPDAITFDYDTAQFAACFALCRDVWGAGPSREDFVEMTRILGRDGVLPPDLRDPFKHVRARFKHMRFALAVFGEKHAYPPVFHMTTNAMGYVQDACNNDRRDLITRHTRLLGWMLSPLPWRLLQREVAGFTPSSRASFDRYRNAQFGQLPHFLAKPTLTPHQFHNSRKVISRFRAFFVTMATLLPTDDHRRIAGWLATLNGLMGNHHDVLIEQRLNGSLDYYRGQIVYPEEIRSRLEEFVSRTGHAQ